MQIKNKFVKFTSNEGIFNKFNYVSLIYEKDYFPSVFYFDAG